MEYKVVLITGASSGIGQAAAHAFAEKGMSLVLGARRVERLEKLCEDLRKQYGVKAQAAFMDVQDYSSLEKSIASLPDDLREVDILINNAGLSLRADKVQSADMNNFNAMIDTNLKGVYNMTRLILPGMLERNRGHIINVGSVASRETYPTGSVYCASKAAVREFTYATRLDVFTSDVRVTLIEPGMTKTEFMNIKMGDDKNHYTNVECLLPEDLANAMIYCATCPPHMNVSEMLIMPTHQASVARVYRRGEPIIV
jgi:NADP-dependent 3-hydroxy acid dehydrogenase YdfG